jgi:hypothetical protein
MNPRYPVFVPTKGRCKTPYTIKALQRLEIPFKAVIEEQEYSDYLPIVGKENIVVLPHQNKGLTVTRNWIWDYAQQELRTPYFWTMDDNIRDFYRLHQNMKYRATSGTFMKAMEDFTERYENLYISGMQYEMFVPRKKKHNPFILNTRIYSNMLIKTDIPYRNVTFYNDDTDLCLRILKDGFCTLLFCAFLADKIMTMQVKGGMTDYYEKTDKRKQFAEELQKAHPDVVKVVWKFKRWHHEVDYRPFKHNRLIKREGVEIPQGVNNYGMKLVKREDTRRLDAGG